MTTVLTIEGSVLRLTITPRCGLDDVRRELADALSGMPTASVLSGLSVCDRDGTTVAEVVCSGLRAPERPAPISAPVDLADSSPVVQPSNVARVHVTPRGTR